MTSASGSSGAILHHLAPQCCRPGLAAALASMIFAGPGADRAFALESCSAGAGEVRVVSVDDWRSVTLDDGRSLRIAGIESFALLGADNGPAETALRDRLASLLADTPIRAKVLSGEPDRYGRLPALAWASAGSVQGNLLREGLAIALANEACPALLRRDARRRRSRRGARGAASGPVSRLPAARPGALAASIGRFAIFEGDVVSVGNRPSTHLSEFRHLVAGGRDRRDRERRPRTLRRRSGAGGARRASGCGVRGFLEEKGGPMLVAPLARCSSRSSARDAAGGRRDALILPPKLRISDAMHRILLVVLAGALLAGCQFAGGAPERVEPVAVVAPRARAERRRGGDRRARESARRRRIWRRLFRPGGRGGGRPRRLAPRRGLRRPVAALQDHHPEFARSPTPSRSPAATSTSRAG